MADENSNSNAQTAFGVTGPDATGCVWETVNTTSSPVSVDVPNENGAVVEIIKYDTRYEFTGTCHGSAAPSFTNNSFTFNDQTYIVDSIEEAGTYNQVKRWTVRGHAFANCSTITEVGDASGSNS